MSVINVATPASCLALLAMMMGGCHLPPRPADPDAWSRGVNRELVRAPVVHMEVVRVNDADFPEDIWNRVIDRFSQYVQGEIVINDHGRMELPADDTGDLLEPFDWRFADEAYEEFAHIDDAGRHVLGSVAPNVPPNVIYVAILPRVPQWPPSGFATRLWQSREGEREHWEDGGTLVTIQMDRIHSRGVIGPVRRRMKEWVLFHELGHALGVPADPSHIFMTTGTHCTYAHCVMYSPVDLRWIVSMFLNGWPMDFCEMCQDELREVTEGSAEEYERSVDGAILAATGTTSSEIAFMRGGHVHIADLETGSEHLVYELEYNRPLVWSPDGMQLIVWKHSEIGWDLWRLDLRDEDNIEALNLTNTDFGGCRSASFSPDGSQIAFMRDGPMGLWIVNADGSNMRRLTDVHVNRDAAPQWSPDGRKILYDAYQGFHLFGLDAEEDEYLMGGTSPQWITEDRILYLARRDGRIVVLVSDLDASNERRLSDPAHRAWSPALSPDRKHVAYIAHGDDAQTTIVVASVEEPAELRELLSQPGLYYEPAWSPDGATLAITSRDEDEPGFWIIEVESGESQKIGDATHHWPAWRPLHSESE